MARQGEDADFVRLSDGRRRCILGDLHLPTQNPAPKIQTTHTAGYIRKRGHRGLGYDFHSLINIADRSNIKVA